MARIKTAVSHRKLTLRSEPHSKDSWKTSTLTFGIYGGHPQIAVWSNHPDEENKTIGEGYKAGDALTSMPIKASTSWPRLRSVLETMLGMIGDYKPITHRLVTLTLPRDKNNEVIKGKKVKQAVILYGRRPDGWLFIEVRNAGRAKIPFFFKEDGWHEETVDDAEMEPAVISDMIALGFIKSLIDVYSIVFVNTYDPDFKPGAANKSTSDKETSPDGFIEIDF